MNTKISVFTIFVGSPGFFAGCSKDDENIPGGIEPPKTILDAFSQIIRMPATQNGQSMTIIM